MKWFSKFYIYELSYNCNTVLNQFLETGTSDKTFSLYPLSFFLYSPFKKTRLLRHTCTILMSRRPCDIWMLLFFYATLVQFLVFDHIVHTRLTKSNVKYIYNIYLSRFYSEYYMYSVHEPYKEQEHI